MIDAFEHSAANDKIHTCRPGERYCFDFGHGLQVVAMVFPDEEVGVFVVIGGLFVGEIQAGDA